MKVLGAVPASEFERDHLAAYVKSRAQAVVTLGF